MNRQEQLEKIIQETPLIERLRKSSAMIGRMCAERRPPKMSIPVDAHDEDVFIGTTLRDAVDELERRRDRVEVFVKGIYGEHNGRLAEMTIEELFK